MLTKEEKDKAEELQRALLVKLEILDKTLRLPVEQLHPDMADTLCPVADAVSKDLPKFLAAIKNVAYLKK